MNNEYKYNVNKTRLTYSFGFFIVGFIAATIIHSETVTNFTNEHNLLNWIGVLK